MLKVVWNIVKYFLGIVQNLLYPVKRLICRRRKLSSSDVAELTSIGTGDSMPMTNSVSGSLPHNNDDIQMEPWDSWGDTGGQCHQQQQHDNYYGTPGVTGMGDNNSYSYQEKSNGQASRKWSGGHHLHAKQQKKTEPEPEPDINFFEDMTPSVQKQKKFLIRKRDAAAEGPPPSFSNRLAVTTNVPLQTSELETWEDVNNAWEDNAESVEDLSWQAEEAIREQRRKERMERQMEQQRKKQRKEEMRGMKGGSLAATKLS